MGVEVGGETTISGGGGTSVVGEGGETVVVGDGDTNVGGGEATGDEEIGGTNAGAAVVTTSGVLVL